MKAMVEEVVYDDAAQLRVRVQPSRKGVDVRCQQHPVHVAPAVKAGLYIRSRGACGGSGGGRRRRRVHIAANSRTESSGQTR